MVILLSMFTFGIYGLYWYVSTKTEMNEEGANIPTAWLLIIPLANIFWLWKYCEGAATVTGKMSAIGLFLLEIIFAPAAIWIIQSGLNEKAA